jgi:DNA helicase II / ATP-dependent DNA helicase PcrA
VQGFERPSGDVREPLTPVDGAPPATIEAFLAAHQHDEAEEIAERIASAGEPWGRFAVLCRKRSLFDPIFRALSDRGVRVQADMLGGFWTRPEIFDVEAWLRLLADPGDNISLTRILLGPAYRLDRRDLFFLADHAKGENRAARRDRRGVLRYSLVDAIVAHEEISDLSEAARERIAAFHRTWCELAGVAARVSLADLVGEVARITGLAAELAASPDPEAEVALRHLAKLRDIAQDFRPAAGEGDLGGFVAYLESVEESEHDEDELRTVDENAVRLLTLHRAKGLEWDVVFIPGLAFKVMPSEHQSENPAKCWQRLPFELRGDAAFLPAEEDDAIKAMKLDEERRLMYVGVTRARRRLVLSRAWFYWNNKTAKPPSIFWDEALETGLVQLTGDDVPCPEANPFAEAGEAVVEGAARVVPSPPPDPVEIARLEPVVERLRAVSLARPRAAKWHCPPVISVTAFLTFVRDEEEFYWRYVRRVPSPPSPAAKLGIELHRRIEEWSRGGRVAAAPPDEFGDEPYDLDVGERRGDGAGGGAPAVSAQQMWENFQRSRFAQMTPIMVEQPFTLYLAEGLSIAGRIDAIFERDDGTWEIVDYKTGATAPDPLQLAIYRKSVEEVWHQAAEAFWLVLRNGRCDPPGNSDVGAVVTAATRLRRCAD